MSVASYMSRSLQVPGLMFTFCSSLNLEKVSLMTFIVGIGGSVGSPMGRDALLGLSFAHLRILVV